MTPLMLNTIGLVLDIIGAVLLWRFVADNSVKWDGEFKAGESRTLSVGDEITEAEAKAYLWAGHLSRLGIGLLVAGFLLQLAAAWLR